MVGGGGGKGRGEFPSIGLVTKRVRRAMSDSREEKHEARERKSSAEGGRRRKKNRRTEDVRQLLSFREKKSEEVSAPETKKRNCGDIHHLRKRKAIFASTVSTDCREQKGGGRPRPVEVGLGRKCSVIGSAKASEEREKERHRPRKTRHQGKEGKSFPSASSSSRSGVLDGPHDQSRTGDPPERRGERNWYSAAGADEAPRALWLEQAEGRNPSANKFFEGERAKAERNRFASITMSCFKEGKKRAVTMEKM